MTEFETNLTTRYFYSEQLNYYIPSKYNLYNTEINFIL